MSISATRFKCWLPLPRSSRLRLRLSRWCIKMRLCRLSDRSFRHLCCGISYTRWKRVVDTVSMLENQQLSWKWRCSIGQQPSTDIISINPASRFCGGSTPSSDSREETIIISNSSIMVATIRWRIPHAGPTWWQSGRTLRERNIKTYISRVMKIFFLNNTNHTYISLYNLLFQIGFVCFVCFLISCKKKKKDGCILYSAQ